MLQDLIKRIGLMVPASNTVIEYEYNRVLPKQISIHASRFKLAGMSLENLAAMQQSFSECAGLLKQVSDVIILGILSGTIETDELNRELEQKIQAASEKPVITVARALLYFIQKLRAKKVYLLTPYSEGIAQTQIDFLKRNGANVIGYSALDYRSSIEASALSTDEIYKLFYGVHQEPDLILFTCTNVRTFKAIKKLYQDTGSYAVSSNLASLMLSLEMLDIQFSLQDFLGAKMF